MPTSLTERRTSKPSGMHRYSRFISESDLFKHTLRDPIASELVQTAAFQRLKDISFLGAISYVRKADPQTAASKQSRYFHSLGVAKLAEHFSCRVEANSSTRKRLVAAGLLHDIGHPPFSHSAESAFEHWFGENHHSMTNRIIRGQERISRDVPWILSTHGIDPEEVIALVDGKTPICGLYLFTGPFNLDTLEGISRCNDYMKGSFSESLPSPELVIEASLNLNNEQNIATLDCFWRLKGAIYNLLIRNYLGLIADKIANDYFSDYRGKLDRAVLLATESELFKQHKKLFEQLYRFDAGRGGKKHLVYAKRSFIVDERFPANQLSNRYAHRKTRELLYY